MTRFITYKGKTRTVAYWARIFNLHPDTVKSRLDYGWTVERALTTPVRGQDGKKDDHKTKKCAKCRYSAKLGGDKGQVYCDYLCKKWDETGEPHRRPCPAEDCTVFEPRKRGRKKMIDGYGFGRG